MKWLPRQVKPLAKLVSLLVFFFEWEAAIVPLRPWSACAVPNGMRRNRFPSLGPCHGDEQALWVQASLPEVWTWTAAQRLGSVAAAFLHRWSPREPLVDTHHPSHSALGAPQTIALHSAADDSHAVPWGSLLCTCDSASLPVDLCHNRIPRPPLSFSENDAFVTATVGLLCSLWDRLLLCPTSMPPPPPTARQTRGVVSSTFRDFSVVLAGGGGGFRLRAPEHQRHRRAPSALTGISVDPPAHSSSVGDTEPPPFGMVDDFQRQQSCHCPSALLARPK